MHWASRTTLVAVIFGGMTVAMPALSAMPQTVSEVLTVCKPIITEEYAGQTDKWNGCIQATQDFVNYVLGPPSKTNNSGATAADLVYQLAQLYQDGEICQKYDTELPEAIAVALKFEMDADQRKLIESITGSISACQTIQTASTGSGEPTSFN